MRDLAQLERYLILSILAGVIIAILGVLLSSSMGSQAVMTLALILRSAAGIASLFFYSLMLRLLQIPGYWAYIVLAIGAIFFAPVITWLLIGYHIVQVNSKVFKPKGYLIGVFGPKTL